MARVEAETEAKPVEHGPRHYSSAQIALHWIIAALVVVQILNHEWMEEAWHARMAAADPESGLAGPAGAALGSGPLFHIVVGVSVLVLAALRVFIRLRRGAPRLPENHPTVLKFIAGANHGLLYVLLFYMPLTGALAWFGGAALAARAHSLGATALLIFVALHVVGAIAELVFFQTKSVHRILGIEPDRGELYASERKAR